MFVCTHSQRQQADNSSRPDSNNSRSGNKCSSSKGYAAPHPMSIHRMPKYSDASHPLFGYMTSTLV